MRGWEQRFVAWDKQGFDQYGTVTGSRIADLLAGLIAAAILILPLLL